MMILLSYDFWKRKNIEFDNFDDEIRSLTIFGNERTLNSIIS